MRQAYVAVVKGKGVRAIEKIGTQDESTDKCFALLWLLLLSFCSSSSYRFSYSTFLFPLPYNPRSNYNFMVMLVKCRSFPPPAFRRECVHGWDTLSPCKALRTPQRAWTPFLLPFCCAQCNGWYFVNLKGLAAPRTSGARSGVIAPLPPFIEKSQYHSAYI